MTERSHAYLVHVYKCHVDLYIHVCVVSLIKKTFLFFTLVYGYTRLLFLKRSTSVGLSYVNYIQCSSRGQNSLCTWENCALSSICPGQLTVLTWLLFIKYPIHDFVSNCNFIACVHFLYLLALPCMSQINHTEGI